MGSNVSCDMYAYTIIGKEMNVELLILNVGKVIFWLHFIKEDDEGEEVKRLESVLEVKKVEEMLLVLIEACCCWYCCM